MRLIERLPGIGRRVGEMKYGVVGMINQRIDSQYKKAINNFKVLGQGLERGSPIPKIANDCEKFVKENWKESKFSEEMRSDVKEVFANIESGDFEAEDGVWITTIFVPYLRNRQRALKLEVMKKTLR